jgi:CRP-like cAMP-binding protein
MTGLPIVFGNHRSPHATYIQAPGTGKCMPATELRKATQASLSLRDSLLKFVQAFGVQTTHTAVSNAQSKLDVRLARWLLMAHDRIGEDTLSLTHEFLSLMLGVRRPGVTEALHALRKQDLISYARGQITVKNRKGLERKAGTAYGIPEAEYRRLIG